MFCVCQRQIFRTRQGEFYKEGKSQRGTKKKYRASFEASVLEFQNNLWGLETE
jgi:hypothetical protein